MTHWAVQYEILYILAMSTIFIFCFLNSRISNTLRSVSFAAWCFSPFLPKSSPVSYACCMFSPGVDHSKLSMRLSFLIPFIWLTNGLFSGFGTKDINSIRWTKTQWVSLFLYKHTFKYPSLGSSFNDMFLRSDLTLPRLLTVYRPSKPTTSLQISFGIFDISLIVSDLKIKKPSKD